VFLGEFGGFGYEDNRFDRPTVVWSGNALAIWVLDQGNARVVKYDLEGRLLGVLVALRSDAVRARLDLVDPQGLAVDQGGELFVTDASADRVLLFDPLGAVLTPVGGFGTQAGALRRAGRHRGRRHAAPARGRDRQSTRPAARRLGRRDRGHAARSRHDREAGSPGRVRPRWHLGARRPRHRAPSACATRAASCSRGSRRRRRATRVPGGLAFDARGHLLVTDVRNHRLLWYRLEAPSP
jgi:sugar lactone lactonase YvrE